MSDLDLEQSAPLFVVVILVVMMAGRSIRHIM